MTWPKTIPFQRDETGATGFAGMKGGAEDSQEGVEVGGKAIHGQQDGSRTQGLTDDLGQSPNPVLVATGPDDASEPEARRQSDGHGQPDDEALKADADLIGLDVEEGAFLQDQVWMDLLDVRQQLGAS